MRLAPVFAVAFLSYATAMGVLAFNSSPHSVAKIAARPQFKIAPQKLWTSRILSQKIPYREIQSLNWLADNRRLWIVKNSFSDERSFTTIWDIATNKYTTHKVPARLKQQNFLTTPDGALAVGFNYGNLPNHLWKPGAKSIEDTGKFEPLLLTHRFIIGWKPGWSDIKIVWWNIKSRKVAHASPVQVPRGYSGYMAGGCGEVGPLLQLSRDGKIGFLILFKDSPDRDLVRMRRVLVFNTRTGKTLRLFKIPQEKNATYDFDGFQSTPDARHILTFKNQSHPDNAGDLHQVLEWRSARNGRLLRSWPVRTKQRDAVISNDGSLIACFPDAHNRLQIFNAHSGALRQQIKGNDKQLYDTTRMKFSPDNRYLATVDGGSVTVWKLR